MIKNIIFAVTGVALGSIVTWKILDSKYKRIIKEEIDDVKQHYEAKAKASVEEPEEEKHEGRYPWGESSLDVNSEEELDKYIDIVSSYNGKNKNEPYTISPDEYGLEDYTEISLLYYPEDDVLVTEDTLELADRHITVGEDLLKRFKNSEDLDVVYIRNDDRKIDYELLKTDYNPLEE